MRLLYITIAVAWLTAVVRPVKAQLDPTGETQRVPAKLQLFTAPDDSSPPRDSVGRNEVLAPMAETLGAGGGKWYLVKTKSGAVGWMKAGNTDESKTLERFFKSLPAEPSASTTLDIPSVSSASAPRGSIGVPVLMIGRSAIVPVTLNHTLNAQLLLDTGASSTMVSQRVASNLALHNMGSATGWTVGGPITRPLARLESLRLGDAEVNNLIVSIHDFSPDPRIEGLLGMDFLGRFQVSLDLKRHVLVLTPR